jgi:acyl-CoA synthetase (AMP-forming)/AMP-acid ligase II
MVLESEKKISILRTLQDHVQNFSNEDCIWTREQTYSWEEALAMVLRYASWFLDLGVKRDECVAFYLQNSAEFMFAWMGLLAINAYPAMVNFNLEGGGLVHCVRISKARIILIDDELSHRVLENDDLKSMGLKMLILNDELKTRIKDSAVVELPESATQGANDMSTLALRYTRCVKPKG